MSLHALFVVKFAIESFNVIQMDASPDDDTQDIDNEDYIKVAAAARGRRSAVDALGHRRKWNQVLTDDLHSNVAGSCFRRSLSR